jgi:four helix bundle protein
MGSKSEDSKIRNFTDLHSWQEGHKLVLMTYKCLKNFPKEENYALSDQMRRSSISVTSCIAEGFSRKSAKDKIHYCHMALGSLTELQNQFIVSRDLGYISQTEKEVALTQAIMVQKLLFGMIKHQKTCDA